MLPKQERNSDDFALRSPVLQKIVLERVFYVTSHGSTTSGLPWVSHRCPVGFYGSLPGLSLALVDLHVSPIGGTRRRRSWLIVRNANNVRRGVLRFRFFLTARSLWGFHGLHWTSLDFSGSAMVAWVSRGSPTGLSSAFMAFHGSIMEVPVDLSDGCRRHASVYITCLALFTILADLMLLIGVVNKKKVWYTISYSFVVCY